MTTPNQFWTSTEEGLLRALLEQRLTTYEMVAHFPNRTRKSIAGKMRRMKVFSLVKPAILRTEAERAHALMIDGASLSEAAVAIGKTRDGLRRRLGVLGLAASNGKRIPAEVLDERDRLPGPRDLTAQLCGDPLPGRSALDRLRGTQ